MSDMGKEQTSGKELLERFKSDLLRIMQVVEECKLELNLYYDTDYDVWHIEAEAETGLPICYEDAATLPLLIHQAAGALNYYKGDTGHEHD